MTNKAYCPICDWEFPIKEAQTCEICKQGGMCVKCYGSHDCADPTTEEDISIEDIDDDDLPDVGIAYTDEFDDDDLEW